MLCRPTTEHLRGSRLLSLQRRHSALHIASLTLQTGDTCMRHDATVIAAACSAANSETTGAFVKTTSWLAACLTCLFWNQACGAHLGGNQQARELGAAAYLRVLPCTSCTSGNICGKNRLGIMKANLAHHWLPQICCVGHQGRRLGHLLARCIVSRLQNVLENGTEGSTALKVL